VGTEWDSNAIFDFEVTYDSNDIRRLARHAARTSVKTYLSLVFGVVTVSVVAAYFVNDIEFGLWFGGVSAAIAVILVVEASMRTVREYAAKFGYLSAPMRYRFTADGFEVLAHLAQTRMSYRLVESVAVTRDDVFLHVVSGAFGVPRHSFSSPDEWQRFCDYTATLAGGRA
jgi:hypothetical protein